jgi:hypothetical protein
MSQNRKTQLGLPKSGPGSRRQSALLPSASVPTLTPFERAYLEKLRNRECPKAVVQFSPTDEIPADADFVFNAPSLTPRAKATTDEAWNEGFLSRRGSGPYIDSSETNRLESNLELPKYTSYTRRMSKNIKAFDTTYAEHKES